MAHTIHIRVTVELERLQGKFAALDEMTDALVEMIEGANDGSISGLGVDGDSEYEIVDYQVEGA